jgi:hypothetical protein
MVREWAASIPEIVNISVNTPYPGTESFLEHAPRLTTRDYRLFDIQHAVLPTRLPLPRFYEELVATQQVLNHKHLGWRALKGTALTATRLLLRGQTNFVRMLWRFNGAFDPRKQLADHAAPVRYEMRLPAAAQAGATVRDRLFVLRARRPVDATTAVDGLPPPVIGGAPST